MSNPSSSISVLIPAAGMGERLGMGAKAFVEIGGRTLLVRAIEAFAGIEAEVIVALPDSYLSDFEVVSQLPSHVRAVAGGSTRQASVANLLAAAKGDIVLIHDAARPFLGSHIIAALIQHTISNAAATTALPASDTLVVGANAHWVSQLDRNQIYAIQTPQGFKRELIVEAHRKALIDKIVATDDAGLVARLGYPVALSPGDPLLFKVTRAGDFALAEAFAKTWDEQWASPT